MSTIGEDLKQQRELKHRTLAEVSSETKINTRYLKALEENRFEILPGPVYAKAYLKAYAAYLGLNAEDLAHRYTSLIAASQGEEPVRFAAASAADRPINPLFIASAVALLVSIGIFLFLRQDNLPWTKAFDRPMAGAVPATESRPVAQPPLPQSPAGADTSAPSGPSPTPFGPAAEPATGKPSPPQPDADSARAAKTAPAARTATVPVALPKTEMANALPPGSPAQPPIMNLEILANNQCWVEAYTDQTHAVGRIIDMGQKLDLQAHDKFLLTLGSAGAVDLRLNGQLMKRAGKLGEVKKLWITADNYKELLE